MFIDRERENRLLAALSRAALAPKMLGRFQGGRVEEWLPAEPLSVSEMCEESKQSLIAKELAELHSCSLCSMPRDALWLDKDTPIVISLLRRWFDVAAEVRFDGEERQQLLQSLQLTKRRQEVEDLIERVVKVQEAPRGLAEQLLTQVVLSHQDLLSGNILYNEEWDRVRIIDMEYAGANYRGYDIANHFCEYAGFEGDMEAGFPGFDTRRRFLRFYIDALRQFSEDGCVASAASKVDDREFLDSLVEVTDLFAMASHAVWAVWAVLQAKYSNIDFDYLDYARRRFEGFDARCVAAAEGYRIGGASR